MRVASSHVLAILLGLALLPAPHAMAQAQVRKLNVALPPGGDVGEYVLSSDGTRAVYRADQVSDEVFELFSVSIDGGDPVRLNPDLVTGGDVRSFACSPDSTRVVYLAYQDSYAVSELYSVSIGGGPAIKLNQPLGDSEWVTGFAISPDAAFVLYTAGFSGYTDLFAVPIDGGASVRLNAEVFQPEYVQTASVTSDGDLAVYWTWFDYGPPAYEHPGSIWSVGTSGGAAVLLAACIDYRLAPDDLGVVYTAGAQNELFHIPAAGGSATKISLPLGPNGTVGIPPYQPFPSSGTAYYSMSEWAALSPDSSRVVYTAMLSAGEARDLYSVPIGGGVSTQLNLPESDMGTRDVPIGFLIAPNSSAVVYSGNLPDIYRVPLAGGSSTRLNGPLVAGGAVGQREITADSSHVVYRADQDVDDVFELYRVPLAGGSSSKLNAHLGPGQDVLDFLVSPDASFVVYRAGAAFVGSQLYRVSLDGAPHYRRLSAALVPGGTIMSFVISTDSSWVVYRADQEQDERFELFATPATSYAGHKVRLAEPPRPR